MKDLSWRAKLYILVAILVGALLVAAQLPQFDQGEGWLWLALSVLATLAHIFKVEGATAKTSYQVSFVVYGFTLIALGPAAAISVTLIAHLVEWVWHRYLWYIQTFNIANFIIAMSVAGWVFERIHPAGAPFSWIVALAVLAAMAAFTLVNHLMVGLAVKLARGESFSQSGVLGSMTLMIDFAMMCMGAAGAIIWGVNPYATVLTIVPLYLIYSTLKVPALERQTQIDPKTGLFNARHYAQALENELARADRFDRPLTIVMADLDLLRNINNTYGHLAGDQVLIGIAEILRKSFRDYDVVARFGGEEFAILMPETTPDLAFPRVESIRSAIEAADFDVPTSVTPIKATMSFGIAGRDKFGLSPSDIIHNADIALYHAKLEGRNQTAIYSSQGLEDFFQSALTEPPLKDEASFEARLDMGIRPFQPQPLRHDPVSEPKPAPTRVSVPQPAWLMPVYIGTVSLLAVAAIYLTLQGWTDFQWAGMVIFGLVVLLTEGLSIEIYAKDTSVSTAVAPMSAGMLLFGPPGVIILSLIQSLTALIKHRSHWTRLVFNASNQILTGTLSIAPLLWMRQSIAEQPILIILALALFASGVSYLVSTSLAAIAVGLDSGYSIRYVWTERFRWLGPFYLALGVVAFALLYSYLQAGVTGVLVLLIPLLMLRFSQAQYIEHTKAMVQKLRGKNEALEKSAHEIGVLNEDLLMALSQVIELRDPYVLGHSQRVAHYAVKIGSELGLPKERIELIRKAALLHDLGKLGVREAILFKPEELTGTEYEDVKKHPLLGAVVIGNCHSLRMLVPIIRHHHEYYDGKGYPDGLKAHDIPIESRILGLADAVEAMASDRPYREALDYQTILKEIRDNGGRQFDPRVVQAFLDLIHREGMAFLNKPGLSPTAAEKTHPGAQKETTPASIPYLEPT